MDAARAGKWRFHVLFGLLGAVLVALGGRVAQLQFCNGAELLERARRQQRRVIVLPARPGNIFARTRGGYVLLAGSRQVPSCYADPLLLGEEKLAPAARAVAQAAGASEEQLFEQMSQRRDRQFVYLVRDIPEAQAEGIEKLKIPGVQIAHEWRRHYPEGPLGAHVVGFRRIDGVAGDGVELQADRWLSAREGIKILRGDAARRGRYAYLEHYLPPEDGKHVVLTLDVVIQGFLEQALAETAEHYAAQAAWGVVMDPNTGEILALGSVPSFDPNRYSQATPEQRRNRALVDPYEPGSCFKPFIAVGAVQLQKATLASSFFCHYGLYRAYRGGTIRDFPGTRYGEIPLSEIVIKSSNIGMAKVGELLGNRLLYQIAEAFGFGQRTNLDLPGEDPGRLVPVRRWSSYATRRMPFGQGPIMVTALQIAAAFSAIANGGELLQPHIIERVLDAEGKVVFQARRQRVRRVLTREVSRQFIDEVLVNVVERGTGRSCRLNCWKVLGKTGTAQIGGPQGYEEHAYTATFVGAAPARHPAAVCVISVYRPEYSRGYTGGKVAAPAVKDVLEKTLTYLDVPPDRFEDVAGPQLPAPAGGPSAVGAARF